MKTSDVDITAPFPQTSSAKIRAHYVLSSHWDREWHHTFQDFRYRLVELIDKIIEALGNGELSGPFTCDGQSIILEDYLEIRPEREADIRRLLTENKMIAGPWYALPDEFLVSGESLIRNLRLGREVTRKFGGIPSNVGFVCDLFGHCSQLPQILHGFGVSSAIVWRGLEPLPDARFWWGSPDGTLLPTLRFGKSGYCDYTYKVRLSTKHREEFSEDRARQDLEAFLQEEARRTDGQGPVLVFDGGDHLEPDFEHYRILKEETPDSKYQITHSSLDAFFEELKPSYQSVTQRIIGELRQPGGQSMLDDQQWLIPGVGSSRVWIKQWNARCQSLLCQWAEPFSLMASQLIGSRPPDSYLRTAWKWLLQNHPHDSICGCSIDQVHEDMKFRFSQCQQIAERLTTEALVNLTAAVDAPLGERELRLGVFNPVSRSRSQIFELTIEIPTDWPEFNEFFGYESKPAFRVCTATGEEIPYQLLAQRKGGLRTRLRDTKYPEACPVTIVMIALPLSLPAIGFTTLHVVGDKRIDAESKLPITIAPTRHPAGRKIAISNRELENDFLHVRVESDGSLTLRDKRSGHVYRQLLTFEDGADIGDGWYHAPAVNDAHFSSVAETVNVAITANGPFLATLRVRVTMRLPKEFDQTRMERSADFTDLIIDNFITLRSGQTDISVITQIKNTVSDHRLRVLFPSGATTASTFLADSPFDIVERPIALTNQNHLLREVEVEAKPQQSWTAVHDDTKGIAIVCDGGLLESGVRDTPERPIILTLYRSTSKTVLTTGEPEGQLLGHTLEFQYRIVPFSGTLDTSVLFDIAQELSGKIRSVSLNAKDVELKRCKNSLPVSASLMSIEGGGILTSLRQVDEDIEIRMFNPGDTAEDIVVKVHPSLSTRKSHAVDFESRDAATFPSLRNDELRFSLAKRKIVTIQMKSDTR